MIFQTIEYVGLLEVLGLGKPRLSVLSSPYLRGIVSPWQPDGILQTLSEELFRDVDWDHTPLGRQEAIRIPAVSKARNLLISTICKFPLEALDTAGPVANQPTFLYRTNGVVSPQERLAWTIDDLIFYGYALWIVTRGADGTILDAAWLPQSQWTITEGHILVNEQPIDESRVLLFNSPFEGLLDVGRTTLRGARDTESAWTKRMESPAYMTELRITDDTNISQTEAEAWKKKWAAAHSANSSSVGITPQGMELVTHQGSLGAADLFIESRNAVRTDVGSFLNIRASMLDGTAGVDSLTYSTTEGEHNSFYEFDIPFWTDPIEWRLSQDDVVPRGTRVRFNRVSAYTSAALPTATPVED